VRKSESLDVEVHLFIEAMRLSHGYDFSHYARASLKRRILGLLPVFGFDHITDLLPALIHDPGFHLQVIAQLSVPVSEMFRDPAEFLVLRERVLPVLHSYPQITVWQAGCANGEEVYSLAILLKEEGLYDRCQIFATDINDVALAKAEEAVYPVATLKDYGENYLKAGGRGSLEDYYHDSYDFGIMDGSLKSNIVFAHHNLVSDGVFCEVHLIMCRNVLIYFDRPLQNRVLKLFHDSFVRGGFLCLGTKESVGFSEVAEDFATIDPDRRIFQFQPKARPASWTPGILT